MALPVHRLFNCIWAWAIGQVDPEKREEWMDLMAMPLPWQVRLTRAVDDWGADDGFEAAFAAFGGGA